MIPGNQTQGYRFPKLVLQWRELALTQTSRGNRYVLVISGYFTKWTEAYTIKNIEAITLAALLVKEFICRFGIPRQLHSDQGK